MFNRGYSGVIGIKIGGTLKGVLDFFRTSSFYILLDFKAVDDPLHTEQILHNVFSGFPLVFPANISRKIDPTVFDLDGYILFRYSGVPFKRIAYSLGNFLVRFLIVIPVFDLILSSNAWAMAVKCCVGFESDIFSLEE
nr:hypothetical protein [Maribacter sp. ACAM166]